MTMATYKSTTGQGMIQVLETITLSSRKPATHDDNDHSLCSGLVIKGNKYCELILTEDGETLKIRVGDWKRNKIVSTQTIARGYALTRLGVFPQGGKTIQITTNPSGCCVALVYFKTQLLETYEIPGLCERFGPVTSVCAFELRELIATNGTFLLKLEEEPSLWDAESIETTCIYQQQEDQSIVAVSGIVDIEWDISTNTLVALVQNKSNLTRLLRIEPETGWVTHEYSLDELFWNMDGNIPPAYIQGI